MNLGLANKTAVVTGASAGIGARIAKSLAQEGCKVLIHYLERDEQIHAGVEIDYIKASEREAALESYTRSLAVELGAYGITVNAIAPGPVQTGWIDAELEKQVLPHLPVGRGGWPADIADFVLFLCAQQSSWLTGQVIRVDGGYM